MVLPGRNARCSIMLRIQTPWELAPAGHTKPLNFESRNCWTWNARNQTRLYFGFLRGMR
jgi:hypothetical protein